MEEITHEHPPRHSSARLVQTRGVLERFVVAGRRQITWWVFGSFLAGTPITSLQTVDICEPRSQAAQSDSRWIRVSSYRSLGSGWV